MAKSTKNGLEKQNMILGQFAKTVRQEEHRIRKGELNQIESIILESARKKAEWEKKKPAPQPFISFYNPNNPLNGFLSKSKDEQKRIMAQIKADKKAQEKAAKELTTDSENC
jgi:cell division protein FtsN